MMLRDHNRFIREERHALASQQAQHQRIFISGLIRRIEKYDVKTLLVFRKSFYCSSRGARFQLPALSNLERMQILAYRSDRQRSLLDEHDLHCSATQCLDSVRA